MKVSTLLPTRQRAGMVPESVRNLRGSDMEILLWVDDDDPQLLAYTALAQEMGLIVYIQPRVGYHGMHTMVNYLAKRAQGEWLLLWNDDARMYTEGWTDKLPTATHHPTVLNIYNSNPEVNLFPLINRSMYRTLGHYSRSAHCDSYVQDIGNELGIHTFVPDIAVEHLRDTINDETKQHSQGAYATTSPLHGSDEMQRLLQADIEKIRKLL